MFDLLCGYLKENGIKKLKIMGGEPTVHKQFMEIVKISQKHFERIHIFTNGIRDIIQNIALREKDSIIYNFNFSNSLNREKLLLDQPGKRTFEVQVNRKTNEADLLNKITEIMMYDKSKCVVSLTLDCVSNIFIDRKVVVPKLLYLQDEMGKNGINYGYDHKIPFCYLYKSNLKNRRSSCSCFVQTAGLIDANLDLRFCNQHSDKLVHLLQEGRFLPWQIIENYILNTHYKNQLEALNKICLECVFYDRFCNGGCWITKDNISRKDILEYSDFPLISGSGSVKMTDTKF
jgi:hypothetical protein